MGLAAGAGTVSGRSAQATQRKDNIPYEVRGVGIQDGGLAPSGNRVSVYDAAKVLGVTVDSIQKRIQRGTMTHERDDIDRGWVLLGTSSTKPDNVQDNYRATSKELVVELREQIRCLREILSKEQDAYRGADAFIAQPTQANAALTTLVDELEALQSREAASPPRPPAGAQGMK